MNNHVFSRGARRAAPQPTALPPSTQPLDARPVARVRGLRPSGWAALAGLALIVTLVLVGPLIWPPDPLAQEVGNRLAPPSPAHPLGTDQYGRDTLARLLAGGRWSLGGALLVCLGTTLLGGLLGAAAAFGPRWLDHVISRITETFQAVPPILLALALTALLRPAFGNLLLALVLTNWTWYARMYRALIVRERAAPYIEGARAIGVGGAGLLVRHILPNILGPALVVATINVGTVVLNLSALSFIGLGLPPPTPEWGTMINEARPLFQRAPRLMLAPGLGIAALVLCVHVLGNALRDRADGHTAA